MALFAQQEAGKTGELLKNEASQKEMQVMKREFSTGNNQNNNRNNTNSGSNTKDAFGYKNNANDRWDSQNDTRSDRRNNNRYNWNQNFGYAEVFLRIPEYGYYTVEIGDQTISNGIGKFRFFDLDSGRMPIAIYQNGYLIYRTQLNVRNNTRIVLDFFNNYGLYLLDSYPVKGQMYGFDQWDDVWNNPYNNGNQGNGNQGTIRVMDTATFENFLTTMKKTTTVDKDKVAFINQQLSMSMFSAYQIKELLKAFSFDDQRLIAAKKLYTRCADVSNFYIVYDTFDFDRHKKDLMNYVSSNR